MERRDVIRLIDKIRIAYPSKKYYETKEDLTSLIDLWLEVFKPYKAEAMNQAVIKAIGSCEFPPTISNINASLNELMQEYTREINGTADMIRHWEMQIDTSSGEERQKYEECLEEEKKTLKRLKEYEFFD